ncbi:unnamed protein product [Closterium sp. NIES-64]|nr:unnamed protein product [Closterium sp. NIES-64]
MIPPLLSPASAAATGTPALPSRVAAVTPPLLSPPATAAAAVPSQTAHAPPSPTGGDTAHGVRQSVDMVHAEVRCCLHEGLALSSPWTDASLPWDDSPP